MTCMIRRGVVDLFPFMYQIQEIFKIKSPWVVHYNNPREIRLLCHFSVLGLSHCVCNTWPIKQIVHSI